MSTEPVVSLVFEESPGTRAGGQWMLTVKWNGLVRRRKIAAARHEEDRAVILARVELARIALRDEVGLS